MRKGIILAVVAAVVVVVAILVGARQSVFAAAFPRIISLATGYDVAFGDQRFEVNHLALLHVHVSKRGEPVLDAARIDIGYSLRDLLPGSKHRYGVGSISIDHPRVTLVRHKDGSYNVTFPQGGGPAPIGPVPVNLVPIAMTVRIRDAEGDVRAPYALDPQSRSLKVHGVNFDAVVNTNARTHYALRGAFIEHPDEPFRAVGTIDAVRGYAMHHAYAAAIPIRSIANFLIDSSAARILAGTASNFDARLYSLDVQPGLPVNYHVSAQLDVSNGGLAIIGLARPLGDIRGRLQVVDDAFFARKLEGTLAGAPVTVTGGIYDFAAPKYRLGLTTHGDLATLRSVFTFSQTQPVTGMADAGVLVEGDLSAPIVVATVDGTGVAYGKIPLSNVHTQLAFANDTLFLAPAVAHAEGADISLRGTLRAAKADTHSEFALHVTAPADRLPYAGEVLGQEPLVADALLDGRNGTFTAHGSMASARGVSRAAATFDLGPSGIVTVSPFWAHTERGTLDGAYHLDRGGNASSFWLVANGLQLTAPRHTSFLAVTLPKVPAFDARIDRVALEGGGPSGTAAFAAGTLSARAVRVSGFSIDALDTRFAGTVAAMAVEPARASGPWGTLAGSGELSNGALIVRGDYHGTLSGLRQFLGNAPAHGTVDGPVALAVDGRGVTIQGDDLALHDASVRGVPLTRASGTFALANGVLRVYNAHAALAGGDVVAAGSYDTAKSSARTALSVVAAGIDGAHLKSLGIPLDAGIIDADGTLGPQSPLPKFDGGVSVRNGRVQKYGVTGSGIVHLGGSAASLSNVVGGFDGTYALASGRVSELTSRGGPAYAIQAHVPAADIARALSTLAIPGYASTGTFNASLAIAGRGLAPSVSGPIGVPAGAINGLPYVDGRATIKADRAGIIARRGFVQVGATSVRFAAAHAPYLSGVRVRAPAAHLADFNNFFDTGDTLHGDGSVALDAISARKRISSNGRLYVRGFRYRNLPIGDTRANWSSARNLLRGALAVGGSSGTLKAHGSIALAPDVIWQNVVRDSRYDVAMDLDNLDLSTWVAALGFPEVPITGHVDADATMNGRFPQLNLRGNARLNNGTAWRLPIEAFAVAFSSDHSRIRIDKGQLTAPGVDATATGSFALNGAAPLDLDVHASSDDLPELVAQLSRVQIPVTGSFESSVHVGGTFAAPTFAAAFDATNVNAYDVKIPAAFGSLRLVGRSLQLRDAGISFEKGDVTIAGTLPLQLAPFGVGPPGAPVSLDLAVAGVDPSDFEALLGNHSQLGGTLDGAIGLSGTVSQPRVSGRFDIAKGTYQSDLERTPIKDIAATLTFDRTEAQLQKVHASLGAGSVDGAGKIVFPNGFTNGVSGGASYSVAAIARGAQFDLPAYGRGALDAKIALTRKPFSEASLSGTAALSNATIPLAAFLAAAQGSGSGDGSAGSAPSLALAFNLDMSAGKNVRVRGSGLGGGLDIGAVGALHVGGDVAAPKLDGTFTSTGGTLTYFDRAFRVQSGSVAFTPANGLVPELHATGTTHVVNPDPNTARNPYGSAEISIKVDGPVNNLKVAFDSTPPGYTKEQIIAMIAPFGGFISGIGYTPGINQPSVDSTQQLGTLAPIPGTTVNQTGTISVGQEAFNVLNAQFTAGLLGPLENAITQGLGFQDFSLTVDYYGNVGFSARRLLGRTVSFIYASTFGVPMRQSFGVELEGSDATSAQLSFFVQNGPTRLFNNPQPILALNGRVTAGEALQGDSGFSFTLQRLYW